MSRPCGVQLAIPARLAAIVLGAAVFTFLLKGTLWGRPTKLAAGRNCERNNTPLGSPKRRRNKEGSLGCVEMFRRFLKKLGRTSAAEKVVAIRTAKSPDAEIYRLLLLEHQKQLGITFSVAIEEVPELSGELQIVVGPLEDYRRQTSNCSPFSTTAVTERERRVGGSEQLAKVEQLLVCRIKLPERRFCCNIPPFVMRVLAAQANNSLVFSTHAAEVLYCMPRIEEETREYQNKHLLNTQGEQKQKKYKRSGLTSSSPSLTLGKGAVVLGGSSRPTSNSTFGSLQDTLQSTPSCGSITIQSQLRVQGHETAVMQNLGENIDVNAVLFSTSLLVCGDSTSSGKVGPAFCCSVPNRVQEKDEPTHTAVREALLNTLFLVSPKGLNRGPLEKLRQNPLAVWRASRQSVLTTAMLYVIDVASANGDPMVCYSRVVDEVVAQAVLLHHDGMVLDFIGALSERFGKQYTPHCTVFQQAVESRREDHSRSGNVSFQVDSPNPCENLQNILEELPYICEFILEHRNDFSNAVLTPGGSNLLEEVFGVPATVFPFLPCARESIAFITQSFNCIVETYGSLSSEGFCEFRSDVLNESKADVMASSQRCFRELNNSRSGIISFEELCHWMARKLSSDNTLSNPDARLLSIAMSLGLPMALLLGTRQEWARLGRAPIFNGEGDQGCRLAHAT
ncbi:uncharacterized protein TEOVI_000428900 [Trypanosoma equiperdum]|uniref:EF-hand domain-containing protein n=2 Tax=Trypanozoon TaxID=39700 RepID=Q582G2_TRYB2|nr:hypothetical protein, conserved [Trypanosoma brucei brucei TREU927]AAX78869.1 hypothetical protein, conserved [Trypanosoma brucei]AAZ12611.1 hypothetical protein, conserved [Trypanosoma brucei brucei TREU927]SCU72711.1 hypothetical protein, conserved [Trypanosoma equiperdum]